MDSGAALFASPQCVGYRGELGKLTSEMCYPSDETIIKQVKAAVKEKAINNVFIATDSRDLISKFKKAMPKVQVKKYCGKILLPSLLFLFQGLNQVSSDCS